MSVRKAVRKFDNEVEFIQYDRDNIQEISDWVGKPYERVNIENSKLMFQLGTKQQDYIELFAGRMPLVIGDYIIKAGEHFYLWKPRMFHETFEEVYDGSN